MGGNVMRIYLKTLGCKVNWLDSMQLQAALVSSGHEIVASSREADTVVVNSCTVTAEANRKSHQIAASQLKQGRAVIATGCSIRIDPLGSGSTQRA